MSSNGVHKSKDSKKEKKKERAVLAEKVANAVESGKIVVMAEGEEEVVVKSDVEENESKEKKQPSMRPVGALVPFANPLADEKVAKKVFRGVKKGLSVACVPSEVRFWRHVLTLLMQLQHRNLSNVASKRSLKRFESLRQYLLLLHLAWWSWQPISRQWMSSHISRFSVRTIAFLTST